MLYFLFKTIGRLFEPIGFILFILLIASLRAYSKKNKAQAFFFGSIVLLISIIGGTKLPAYFVIYS